MHQPMRPVEIGVMRHDDRHQADREIADPGGLEIQVNGEDPMHGAEHDADTGQRKQHSRPQRGQDFALDVDKRCRSSLDFAQAKPGVPEQFQDQRHAEGRDDIAADIQDEIGGPDLPEAGYCIEEGLHGDLRSGTETGPMLNGDANMGSPNPAAKLAEFEFG